MPGRVIERTVTILAGASLSEEINIGDAVLVGVQPDSTWTTAAISFLSRTENNALGDLKFEGTEVSALTIAAEEYVGFSPTKFPSIQFLQVRSGISGAAVNQVIDSIVTLVLRAIA